MQARLTFLKSYRSVADLNSHMPATPVGASHGSVGCQYSMNPASSAETTVSYRSLYCDRQARATLSAISLRGQGRR